MEGPDARGGGSRRNRPFYALWSVDIEEWEFDVLNATSHALTCDSFGTGIVDFDGEGADYGSRLNRHIR